jgi:hypothetical protein
MGLKADWVWEKFHDRKKMSCLRHSKTYMQNGLPKCHPYGIVGWYDLIYTSKLPRPSILLIIAGKPERTGMKKRKNIKHKSFLLGICEFHESIPESYRPFRLPGYY